MVCVSYAIWLLQKPEGKPVSKSQTSNIEGTRFIQVHSWYSHINTWGQLFHLAKPWFGVMWQKGLCVLDRTTVQLNLVLCGMALLGTLRICPTGPDLSNHGSVQLSVAPPGALWICPTGLDLSNCGSVQLAVAPLGTLWICPTEQDWGVALLGTLRICPTG